MARSMPTRSGKRAVPGLVGDRCAAIPNRVGIAPELDERRVVGIVQHAAIPEP